MRLTQANSKAVEYACKHFHYSLSVPAVQFAYNVYNEQNEWCGCILFGGVRTIILQSLSERTLAKF